MTLVHTLQIDWNFEFVEPVFEKTHFDAEFFIIQDSI